MSADLTVADLPEPTCNKGVLRRNTQAFTAGDGSGVAGDCWRTAISCVLGIDRDDVPHFVQLGRKNPDSVYWYTAALGWLAERGFQLHALRELRGAIPAPYAIATGMGPRGYVHAVIVDASTGETVWDPHPSRDGLAGPADRFEFITRAPVMAA